MKTRTRRLLGCAGLLGLPPLAIAAWVGFLLWIPQSQPAPLASWEPAPPIDPIEGRPSGRAGPIDIVITGDAMLGRLVGERLARNQGFDPFAELGPALADADLVVLNLETTITDRGTPWPFKAYHFQVAPEPGVRGLRALPAPIGAAKVASLANNHALDFGREGLLDTLDRVREAGFLAVGAGADSQEARAPVVVETASGVRVGVLAVTDHCGCVGMSSWAAGPERPGAFWANLSNQDGQDDLLARVRALDLAVDVVLVSLHSGPNWLPEGPPDWLRRVARELVHAGADVVFDTSAHHLLPVEVLDGRHVLYGLGPLVDDYRLSRPFQSDLGAIARVRVDGSGEQRLDLVPIQVKGKGARLLSPDSLDYAEVLRRVRGDDADPE